MPKVLVFIVTMLVIGCDPPKTTLSIFAAASAGPWLKQIEKAYEKKYPATDLRIELSASRHAIHKITEQKRMADLVISADDALLDNEIRQANLARSTVSFASNALVLALNEKTDCGQKIIKRERRWPKALAGNCRLGAANPKYAPVGYRALMALQLQDKITPPSDRTGHLIAAKLSPEFLRPDVSKLIAPLQSGEIEAAFIYRSEALQHKLSFVELDPRINFGDPQHGKFYQSARLERPNKPDRQGSTATYGLTIPKVSTQQLAAQQLLQFMLSATGRAIGEDVNFPLMAPEHIIVRGDSLDILNLSTAAR